MLPPCPLSNHRRRNPWAMKCSQSPEQAEVDPRWGGEGAREVEVVVGVPQPLQGREQDAVFESLCDAADDFAQELAVGEERHVVPALLQGRDREDDGRFRGQAPHLGPGHLLQQHRIAGPHRPTSVPRSPGRDSQVGAIVTDRGHRAPRRSGPGATTAGRVEGRRRGAPSGRPRSALRPRPTARPSRCGRARIPARTGPVPPSVSTRRGAVADDRRDGPLVRRAPHHGLPGPDPGPPDQRCGAPGQDHRGHRAEPRGKAVRRPEPEPRVCRLVPVTVLVGPRASAA